MTRTPALPPGGRALTKAIVLGVAAGFVGGMFGVGGGIVMVPGLVLWLGVGQHVASATSLAAIVAASATAVASFALDGEVDVAAALVLFAGSGIGAATGARVMARIPERILTRAFVGVLLISAVRLAVA